MKHIISAYSTLFVILLNAFVGIETITLSGNVSSAKEYKAAVVAEIENSNFNQNVINNCIAQAASEGYSLQITNCTYDENNNITTAEVVLNYDYEIPILKIKKTTNIRGIAR